MALSSFYREKVYDCVARTLRAVLDDYGDDSSGKAARNVPSTVIDIIAAVQSAANEAYADFSENWNRSYPDLLIRLPTEVAVQCFKPLPSSGRIAVSHVSRAWRRVALAERSLWAQARIAPDMRDSVTKLTEWFSRSHPLPFRLTWRSLPSVDDCRVLALLIQNLDRIQSLETEYVPSTIVARIFEHPAPILQTMTLDCEEMGSCTLPKHWGPQSAPQLNFLAMGVFSVPDTFEPLLSMRRFRGWLPNPDDGTPAVDLYAGLHALFDIFPHLVQLELANITDESLSRIPNLPGSLYLLVLCTSDPNGVDFSGFIEARVPDTLKRLSMDSTGAVAATIDTFAARVRGAWSMTIRSDEHFITLADNESDRVYLVHPRDEMWWEQDPPNLCRLDQLKSLVLSLDVFLNFCYAVPPWNLTLRGLRSLTLTAVGDEYLIHSGRMKGLSAVGLATASPMHAARLEEVVLQVTLAKKDLNLQHIIATFPANILQRLVVFDSDRAQLDTVTIELPSPFASKLLDEDLSELTPVAHYLRICDSSTIRVIAEFLDGERLQEQ